jgi:hypothetical protein
VAPTKGLMKREAYILSPVRFFSGIVTVFKVIEQMGIKPTKLLRYAFMCEFDITNDFPNTQKL